MPVFVYKAVQSDGKTRRGQVSAVSESEAFAQLRRDNLSPLSLKTTQDDQNHVSTPGAQASGKRMSETEIEALLGSLAVLLRAGADIRAALSVLGDDNPALKDVSLKVLGGAGVEAGLSPLFRASDSHLLALIAAGEMRGDLPAGLEAAAQVIATRRKIRAQLIEALSYPAFVFITALAALAVILLVVVPAIAPLLTDSGNTMPVYFSLIVWLSAALQVSWAYLLMAACAALVLFIAGYRYGGLKHRVQAWMLDGPTGRIVGSLVFGSYARTMGDMLSRGANLTDALRLCQRSAANGVARERLEVVSGAVRQGKMLSEGLRQVKGFPKPVIKLAEVGEASSALGPMLMRAGEREEEEALLRIGRLSKLLGPALIMVLGAMIGLIMAGVLSALTDIGSIAGSGS